MIVIMYDVLRSGDKNVGTHLGGLAPQKFSRANNVHNSAQFRTTLDFDRDISGMDQAITKLKSK